MAIYRNTEGGYANFLVVEPFADLEDNERGLQEEKTATVAITGYLIPLLRKIFVGQQLEGVRILDVGCGVGKSVDLLCDAGFDAWGVDSGHRISLWHRRKNPAKLVIAGGEAMPFEDGVFDFIFCAGVIEHVGCNGDARTPSPGYSQARLRFAQELVRVTRPGGYLNITCPNRHFLFDLFHRNSERNPWRFHWPWDPFLFSKRDLRRLLVDQCGCSSLSDLPIRGYWGFFRLTDTLVGSIGCKAANIWFNTLSSWPLTRGSFLNPWLSVLAQK